VCDQQRNVYPARSHSGIELPPACGAPPHTIKLQAGTYKLTIGGENEDYAAEGDLDIKMDVTINGISAGLTTVDAGGIDRVFEIFNGYAVKIHQATIRGGHIFLSAKGGGGIRNAGELTLKSVHVVGNESGASFVGKIGQPPYIAVGGIFNDSGILELQESQVIGNRSNLAHGGIHNSVEELIVKDSAIIQNGTLGDGGGITNTGGGIATIDNRTISGNTAARGGGIIDRGNEMKLTNSTISGNEASKGDGGAIYSNGITILTNNTIANNGFGVTTGAKPSGIYLQSAKVLLANTIIDEGATGCAKSSPASSVTSQGYTSIADRPVDWGRPAIGRTLTLGLARWPTMVALPTRMLYCPAARRLTRPPSTSQRQRTSAESDGHSSLVLFRRAITCNEVSWLTSVHTRLSPPVSLVDRI
jgi:predicted outer membrane repeat protein